MLSAPSLSLAQDADVGSAPQPDQAKNALYVELATLIFTGAASINYERILTDNVSLRVGYGVAGAFFVVGTASGNGPQVMAHFFFGEGTAKFELGAGAAFMFSEATEFIFDTSADELLIFPSIALGLRLQPYDGGFFGRFGTAWTYGYGIGFVAGLGAVF